MKKFGIKDLETHRFDEIVSWHDPKKSTPLRREMLRWSQLSNKQVFDEVFVRYGRSLKPDLIVAQWNHLGEVSQISGDERCLLPADAWGKAEDFLWYSTGGAAPEQPDPERVHFETSDGVLKFDVPRFLVYAVARIQLDGPLDSQTP